MKKMLHMKLLLSSTALAVLTFPYLAFSAGLTLDSIGDVSQSYKLAKICFLPDCQDDGIMSGDIDMDINTASRWCEKKGYKYYSSGQCPQYYKEKGRCMKNENYYINCSAEEWCTDNGYQNTSGSCSGKQTLDTQCPNLKNFYKNCKCKAEFKYYSGNCSGNSRPEGVACSNTGNGSGLDKKTYYNQCNCYPNTKPVNYEYSCTGDAIADGCGRNYRRCCSDVCSRGSKNYSGSSAGRTECGTPCYYCRDCTSGSTSYSGSYVGSSECGSCYAPSDTCSSGTKGGVSCSGSYRSTLVSYTEKGNGCYECRYNTDCDARGTSCGSDTGGCNYNSCSRCVSCKAKPAAKWVGYIRANGDGWCSSNNGSWQFLYSVVKGCRDINSGSENDILTTEGCYGQRGYSSEAECKQKGYYDSYSENYGTCPSSSTTPDGYTSSANGRCV